MATTLQFNRGTEAEANAFVGSIGELFIDLDNKNIRLMDGSTSGGTIIASDIFNYIHKDENYTANVNDYVFANTSLAGFNITLPSSPAIGDKIIIQDSAGYFSDNNAVVLKNGSTIMGLDEDISLDINNVKYQFLYDGDTWRVSK